MTAPRDVFDLAGRVIVVTGGLGQLGTQFAEHLRGQGARVAIFDLRSNGREEDDYMSVAVDVTSRASIEAGLARVVERWGVPSGLVNNAGLDSPPDANGADNGPFESYPAESWNQVMAVNASGVMYCCQVIGGAMAAASRGAIVNVSSIYGLLSPNQTIYEYRRTGGDTFFKPIAYSASKSAVLNMSRYLATYWARAGVRVNTITLAGVFNNQDERFLANYCDKIPIGRMADEAEYNGAIQFLLSPASSYMTGSNLVIDGGWSAW